LSNDRGDASKKSTVSTAEVDLYDKLIATIPKTERKGAANPYASLNGHIHGAGA
jgi:hypothetical protein